MLDGAIEDAVRAHYAVSIGTFDGSASSVRWQTRRWITDRDFGDNPENQEKDDNDARACLKEQLKQAATATAQLSGTDILGALEAGGDVLTDRDNQDAQGPKKMVIATDGLANTGCADLARVSIGDSAAIARITQLCDQRRTKPLNFTGIEVSFVGIGHPADSQPQPSTLQLNWLRQLWRTLCEATRATCTSSAAQVDMIKQAATGDSVTDPVVSFPPPDHGITQDDGSTLYQLDSSVLFDENSSAIKPDGETSLTRIASEITTTGASRVVVNGYTEARATPDVNEKLAQDRANTVGAFLSRRGVSVVIANGHPGTAPQCPPQTRNGRSDPIAEQCNRRVDIVAYP